MTDLKKINDQLGTVVSEPKRKCKRQMFVSADCGDLTLMFEGVAWANEGEDFPPMTPECYITVRGYKRQSSNGRDYLVNVAMPQDPRVLKEMAKAFNDVAMIYERTGIRTTAVSDVDGAVQLFKKG